jgi:hypothetical protein
MKAEEARAKTEAAIPNVIVSEYNALIERINEATGKGEFEVVVDTISDENKEKIKELEYKVTSLKNGVKINWAGGRGYSPKGTPKVQ